MGIKTEFNPDLALRNISEYREGTRSLEECIPENLEVGKDYTFLKEGQRVYWLLGPVPLRETQGNEKLSPPMAAIQILEATHFLRAGKPYTSGYYRVVKIKDSSDSTPLFDGLDLRR